MAKLKLKDLARGTTVVDPETGIESTLARPCTSSEVRQQPTRAAQNRITTPLLQGDLAMKTEQPKVYELNCDELFYHYAVVAGFTAVTVVVLIAAWHSGGNVPRFFATIGDFPGTLTVAKADGVFSRSPDIRTSDIYAGVVFTSLLLLLLMLAKLMGITSVLRVVLGGTWEFCKTFPMVFLLLVLPGLLQLKTLLEFRMVTNQIRIR